jgi:hypothetical protein
MLYRAVLQTFLTNVNIFLAVVKINGELSALVQIALRTQMDRFRTSLDENNLSDELKNSIMFALGKGENPVNKAFDSFKSPKLIMGYLRDNFNFIPPTTVKLGAGSFQYISVIEVLKKIRADKTYQQMKIQPAHSITRDEDDFLIEDIQDGLLFKNNKFFLDNPEAIRRGTLTLLFSLTHCLTNTRLSTHFLLFHTIPRVPMKPAWKQFSIQYFSWL